MSAQAQAHIDLDIDTQRQYIYFDRDFKQAIRRSKLRYKDGREQRDRVWFWESAALGDNFQQVGRFSPMKAAPWLAQHYPELEYRYEALHWYGIEDWMDDRQGLASPGTHLIAAQVVITANETDADSFNHLMAAAGIAAIRATCLCHPKPSKLASHHLRLICGRDVTIIGDPDEVGRQHAENWTRLLWGHAACIRGVQIGLDDPECGGLSDWIDMRNGGPGWQQVEDLLSIL